MRGQKAGGEFPTGLKWDYSTPLIPRRDPNSAFPSSASKIDVSLRVKRGRIAALEILSRKNSRYRVVRLKFHV